MKMATRNIRTFWTLIFVFAAATLAYGDYTLVKDNTSDAEIDLWQALNAVAPLPAPDWTSTSYLNSGADGRRLADGHDNIWTGSDITVTALTGLCGGLSTPSDLYAQQLVYDTDLSGTTPVGLPVDVAHVGRSVTFQPNGTRFIFGDRAGSTLAWSRDSLNTGSLTDRMLIFDVSTLSIYAWNQLDNAYTTLVRSATEVGPAYVVTFEIGSDRDYQDLLVLVEGTRPVAPAPGAVMLGSIGLAMVGWIKRRFA